MTDVARKQKEDPKIVKRKSPEHKRAEREAWSIESTLKAFGIESRVFEVNLKKKWFEYCIELKNGTPIESVVCLNQEIANAVVTPTSKVKIQAPTPKKAFIRILVTPGKP